MKNKLFFFIQALLRYCPYNFGIGLRNQLYPYFFKAYGKNVRIFDSVIIKYPDDIALGDNLTINQFCYIVGKGGLKIGNDVMIGAGSKITTSSHNFSSTNIPMRKQGINFEPIHIQDNVWLGFNVVLLGGGTIGSGSILAANTVVVLKEVPAFSIVAGVPGRIVRNRKESE